MSQTFTLELGNEGGSHKFKSARALRAWVNEESSKWSWVLNFSGTHIAETQRNPLTEQRILKYLRQAEASEASNNDGYQAHMNAAISYLKRVFLSDRLPVYSGSHEGRFILDNKEKLGSGFASMVLGYISNDPGYDGERKPLSGSTRSINWPM
jgi:hypothetical protein